MVILGIIALILISFSWGSAQESAVMSKKEAIPIPADKIQPIKPPVATGDKDACLLEYTNWSPSGYFGEWGVGDKVAIYFDPTDCGHLQNYPFQLTDVELVLYDYAGVGSVDVRFSVEIVCSDICDGPGVEIYKSPVYHITDLFPDYEYTVVIDFPEEDTICLDKPFFFNLEYMSGDPGTIPSLLFGDEVVDTCYQWVWFGQPDWWEWYDTWSPPIPGWILLGISGYCGAQADCGDWYWKPDTTNAPSGMPDFDWHQLDKGLGLCGPTAVANCLWWFGHVPELTTPPELIAILAEFFNTGPGGTDVESMQAGLDMYFAQFNFPLKEITYWMPDFYEMEDSLKVCQDIILLLGFWWWNDGAQEWFREGGHYVTMAGVNSEKKEIAISDPDRDQCVQYPWWPGRVRLPDHPPWGDYRPEFHNDPNYVSHDVYISLLYPEFPSPGSEVWELADYCYEPLRYSNMNVPERFRAVTKPAPKHLAYWRTEVEAAVMICPKETAVEEEKDEVITPEDFQLFQNHPNPFNNETLIKYTLSKSCHVSLGIYNVLGQKVRTLVMEYQKPGVKTVSWDGKDEKGKDLSSGIYLYQLSTGSMGKADEVIQTKRMLLLK